MKVSDKQLKAMLNSGSHELSTDWYNMHGTLKKEEIEEILFRNLLNFSNNNTSYKGKRIAEMFKFTYDVIYSDKFQEVLDDPTISVQPMTGPVGLAIWNMPYHGVQKTAVESGTRRLYDDPLKSIRDVYDELDQRKRERAECGMEGFVIFCPYIIVGFNENEKTWFSRYGVVDHMATGSEVFENE